jgi:hypothetical protein
MNSLILLAVLSATQASADSNFAGLREQVAQLETQACDPETLRPSVIHYSPATEEYGILSSSKELYQKRVEIDGDILENDYFKVVAFDPYEVEGERRLKEEPLSLCDFDGRNVMYHLMRARNYFQKFDPESEALHRKITVRLRADRQYNFASRYGKRNFYNAAGYFPEHFDKGWGAEIWFFDRKTQLNWKPVLLKSALTMLPKPNPLALIAIPITIYSHWTFGADMAKIPAAIYNEAFHWATDAAHLLPANGFSNPVVEAYSNYFSAAISDNPRIADVESFIDRRWTQDISKVRRVKAPKKSTFSESRIRERFNYYRSPLIPALLWQIRMKIGANAADSLIWSSVSRLKDTTRPSDLPEVILASTESQDLQTTLRAIFDSHRESLSNLDLLFEDYYGHEAR